MWIEHVAKLRIYFVHRCERLLSVHRHTRHQLSVWRRANAGGAVGSKLLHKRHQPVTVLFKVVVQKALKVAGDLNVHGRR